MQHVCVKCVKNIHLKGDKTFEKICIVKTFVMDLYNIALHEYHLPVLFVLVCLASFIQIKTFLFYF